jgi:hypothetical protein
MVASTENIILTGVPRSGTTLACRLLNQLPQVVALHEPMQGIVIEDQSDLSVSVDQVESFFAEQRRQIANTGRARSRNIGGRVPDNPFEARLPPSGVRQNVDALGEILIEKSLAEQYWLVMKHTNRFAPLLRGLVERFPVYALVRNPLASLASWQTVSAGIRLGRAGPAVRMAPSLLERLGRIEDALDRQLCLLDWFFEQFLRHLPRRSVIQYEALVESRGKALSVIHPTAASLNEPLSSRNASALYDEDQMSRIAERLLKSDGAYWQIYSREKVASLLQQKTNS